jgi:predicted  nucleic acid-binding Zn-ribbon protein
VTGSRTGARIEKGRERRATIFDSVSSSPLDDRHETGTTPGEGTFFCLLCGSQLSMEETDKLPDCPDCGGSNFRRDSIFSSHQDHRHQGQATSEFHTPSEGGTPSWLARAREQLPRAGHSLALQDDDGEIQTFQIERGWTRIGRSPNADLRLDDPSVSRRHALVVAEPGKPLRVLDDRSLNGVFLNGETIEWAALHDGDELAIGRYRLFVLQR